MTNQPTRCLLVEIREAAQGQPITGACMGQSCPSFHESEGGVARCALFDGKITLSE